MSGIVGSIQAATDDTNEMMSGIVGSIQAATDDTNEMGRTRCIINCGTHHTTSLHR